MSDQLKMPKIFLSGKMTGQPDHGYFIFNAYEKLLKSNGFHVINPACIGVHNDWTWEDYMKRSLSLLLESNFVAMLPGYYSSRGARTEMYVAGLVNIPVHPVEYFL